MPTGTTEELYSQVQNTSGVEMTFGFLGVHGMTLAADEVIAIPGDIVSIMGQRASIGRRRDFDSFERSLKDGRLQINSRPAPILYDNVANAPRSLSFQDGVLGSVDPEYQGYEDSERFAAVDT